MGLDCIPKPYPCQKLGIAKMSKNGKINCKGTTKCPFRKDNQPFGILGTLCWYRGKAVAYELEALGENDLSERCYEEMSRDEAMDFGAELLSCADRLEKHHSRAKRKPRGAEWGGIIDRNCRLKGAEHSSFKEALAEIRTAGEWYVKVAKLGCGVETWF